MDLRARQLASQRRRPGSVAGWFFNNARAAIGERRPPGAVAPDHGARRAGIAQGRRCSVERCHDPANGRAASLDRGRRAVKGNWLRFAPSEGCRSHAWTVDPTPYPSPQGSPSVQEVSFRGGEWKARREGGGQGGGWKDIGSAHRGQPTKTKTRAIASCRTANTPTGI